MRMLMILTVVALCLSPAIAQEEAEPADLRMQMRTIELRMKQLDLEALRQLRSKSAHTIAEELNDIERESDQIELALAQAHARHEVMFRRIEQQKELMERQQEVVVEQIERDEMRRAAMEEELERLERAAHSEESEELEERVRDIRMGIMEIEERAVDMRLGPLYMQAELGEGLMEIEVQAATYEVTQAQLARRTDRLQEQFDHAIAIEEKRVRLETEFLMLQDRMEMAARAEHQRAD